MRRLIIIAAGLAFLAWSANAGDVKGATVTCSIGTNASTAVTGTVSDVRGELKQIEIDETIAGMDVDIDVYYVPVATGMTAVTLYSADDVTADTMLYPAVYRTDSAAASLTNGAPDSVYCSGGALRVIVDDWNATGKVVTVRFVWKE